MRNQYRVTKYDPALRDSSGAFSGDEWTSHSDIGGIFGGERLSESAYLAVENSYLQAVAEFLQESGVDTLQLQGLERGAAALPEFITPLAELNTSECVEFARLALREDVWGKLVSPGRAYIHFGYDYYMYLGLPVKCSRAISAARERGLFVERFRSPYLRQAFNKSAQSGRPTASAGLNRW